MHNSSPSFLDTGADLILRSHLLPTANTLPLESPAVIPGVDISESLLGTPVVGQPVVGQPVVGQYFDQDFFGSSGEILNNFVESGQVWALLIGFVIGYLVRGLTTY
ncbi:MAG: hypothetical protein AAF921_10880 [Cyanobacteria bacterium P01_D01_bin.44]